MDRALQGAARRSRHSASRRFRDGVGAGVILKGGFVRLVDRGELFDLDGAFSDGGEIEQTFPPLHGSMEQW
jgi:hypothetical protein